MKVYTTKHFIRFNLYNEFLVRNSLISSSEKLDPDLSSYKGAFDSFLNIIDY